MLHQSACPRAHTFRLRVTHAAVKANHRVGNVGRDVEHSHVAHVLLLPAAHNEIVMSRLHYMILKSTNRWVHVV